MSYHARLEIDCDRCHRRWVENLDVLRSNPVLTSIRTCPVCRDSFIMHLSYEPSYPYLNPNPLKKNSLRTPSERKHERKA